MRRGGAAGRDAGSLVTAYASTFKAILEVKRGTKNRFSEINPPTPVARFIADPPIDPFKKTPS